VCDKWNLGTAEDKLLDYDLSGLAELPAPVMVLSGEFDPITPASNGKEMSAKFANSQLLTAKSFGHVPSLSEAGESFVTSFISQPNQMPDLTAFQDAASISFAKNIKLNGGVSNMGTNLSELNPMFLVPLVIALVLMVVFIFIYLVKLIRGEYEMFSDKLLFVFIALLLLTTACFFLQIRKINERSVVLSVIFSHMVMAVYFMYWGVL